MQYVFDHTRTNASQDGCGGGKSIFIVLCFHFPLPSLALSDLVQVQSNKDLRYSEEMGRYAMLIQDIGENG